MTAQPGSTIPGGDEFDARIPDTSTAWQLWHSDTFDGDSAPSLQASGTNIVQGLYRLWLCTLKEGILDNGSASFSRFHLVWGDTPATRADVAVDPFDNRALLKLRQWGNLISEPSSQREVLLLKLAQSHFELLQKSHRWKASAIDWSAEAREILARIESIDDPGEI